MTTCYALRKNCSVLSSPGLTAIAVVGVVKFLGGSIAYVVMVLLLTLAVFLGRFWLGRFMGSLPAVLVMSTIAGVLLSAPMIVYTYQSWFLLRIFYSAIRLLADMLIGIGFWLVVGLLIYLFSRGCAAVLSLGGWFFKLPFLHVEESDSRLRKDKWRAALFLAAIVVAGAAWRPLDVYVCTVAAKHYHLRLMEPGPPPSPLERWALMLQYGYDSSIGGYWCPPQGFLYFSEDCRERLVRWGALVHRTFEFQHVRMDSCGAKIVRAAFQAFPDNVHISSSNWVRGEPLILEVWAPPDEIPKWEQFVREHDVPCDTEEGGPGPHGD